MNEKRIQKLCKNHIPIRQNSNTFTIALTYKNSKGDLIVSIESECN